MKSLLIIGILVFYGDPCRRLYQLSTFFPRDRGRARPELWQPALVVTLPVTTSVDVQVMQKDSVYQTVDVVFGGGNGQVQVSSCDVVFTRSDGTSETRQLKPEKGATVTLQGTKGTDRVEVSVTMKDGKTYKIIDQQVPYRTRG